ncbi:hypothetical protein [Microbulbifer sp. ALW1]|uniref:hypothetical protein n=1 Tax=Microbulbifer sp. (strain ALW1) TaxID=1516059 RepID=UPI00135A07C1|nr:hypothetical protein [Microbulbifer sp. ALW1]
MALRLNPGLAPMWYQPKDTDPADSSPAAFLLEPLTEVQTMEVMADGTIDGGGTFYPNHGARLKMLAWGVKGWRNVEDANGAPLEFKPGGWQQLPWNLLGELANEIMTRSALREDERKNSLPQSSLPETPAPSIAATASGADTATTPTPHLSQSG